MLRLSQNDSVLNIKFPGFVLLSADSLPYAKAHQYDSLCSNKLVSVVLNKLLLTFSMKESTHVHGGTSHYRCVYRAIQLSIVLPKIFASIAAHARVCASITCTLVQ